MLMKPLEPLAPAPMGHPDRRRLAELDLLGGGFELTYDRLSALACDLLSAPSGAVSIIDDMDDRQYFKSFFGLPEDLAIARSTPLSRSLCRIVRATDAGLSITDARQDARFRDHPAHVDMGVVAYLGQPIHLPCGQAAGAICVFDVVPRDWSEADIHRLHVLAGCVDEAIRRIAAAQEADAAQRTAARAIGARELFLAGLNHEIRTALNGVLGATAVLGVMPLDDEAAELVQMLDQSGNELNVLLETLLNQTDSATLKRQADEPQSLREIFAEVFGVLRFTRLGEAHRFMLELTGDEGPIGDLDARRFKQLAYDLLGAAVVASPTGSTEFRVTVLKTSGATVLATLNTDPQVDDDLRNSLADLDFRHVCNLAVAARGGFDIVSLEPHRAVLEVRLPFGAGDSRGAAALRQ